MENWSHSDYSKRLTSYKFTGKERDSGNRGTAYLLQLGSAPWHGLRESLFLGVLIM